MQTTREATAGYLPVPGGELWYEVAGSGHPLLLIHAGVADHTMWDPQWAAFAQRYRAIRYDARGYGKSKTEDVSFSNRQDAYDLLNHLGVDRAYVLGLSRGGQIAIDFTVEHPEKVAALIAVAAGLSGFEGTLTDAEIGLIEQMEAAENAQDWERMTDLDVQVWVDGPGQPAGRADQRVREQVRAMCLSNYRTHTIEGQPQPLDPPANERLSAIRVPTLVIVGDLDFSSEIATADRLADGIAGARKEVFHGVAHMVNMEQPERFNRIVLDFLGQVEQPTSNQSWSG